MGRVPPPMLRPYGIRDGSIMFPNEPGSSADASPLLLVRSPVAQFLALALQRQLDQPIDKLPIWKPAGLPQLGVHADIGKPGDRIDLVHQRPAAPALDEEVHPRHAGAIDCLERL